MQLLRCSVPLPPHRMGTEWARQMKSVCRRVEYDRFGLSHPSFHLTVSLVDKPVTLQRCVTYVACVAYGCVACVTLLVVPTTDKKARTWTADRKTAASRQTKLQPHCLLLQPLLETALSVLSTSSANSYVYDGVLLFPTSYQALGPA